MKMREEMMKLAGKFQKKQLGSVKREKTKTTMVKYAKMTRRERSQKQHRGNQTNLVLVGDPGIEIEGRILRL